MLYQGNKSYYMRNVWPETTSIKNTSIMVIYIKIHFVKYTYCIKDVSIDHSNTRYTYVRDINADGTYLKNICNLIINIKNTFIYSFSTIRHLTICF